MSEAQQLPLKIIRVWVQGSGNRTEFVFRGLIHDLEEQLLLRGEVVVQRRFGAADPRTDIRHRSAFEPHLAENFCGAQENGLAFRFGFGLHERRSFGTDRYSLSVSGIYSNRTRGV